jgi:ABC-type proline/glycine betaine transport system permease subunit
MGKDLFISQIYVDDIIFGSSNKSFCDEFSKIMTVRFEMSMMEVLTFFLGFQIKQAKEGLSLAKQNIHMTYLKSLAWTMQSQSRLPWVQMVILILIWAAHRLIKRCIAP